MAPGVSHRHYDVAIAGGGLAGASLALALSRIPLRVALIEPAAPNAAAPAAGDDRGMALSPASRRILAALEVWPVLDDSAMPIRRIHISEQGRFGVALLDAAMLNAEALGWTVAAGTLGRVLLDAVESAGNVEMFCPARVERVSAAAQVRRLILTGDAGNIELECRLLVAADGARSSLRDALGIAADTHDYGQTAIVAGVTPAVDPDGTAFERFSDSGPLALLPMREGRCKLVCCVPRGEANAYLEMSNDDFLEAIDRRFGRRLGGFCDPGKRSAWPLLKVRAERQTAERAVLIGNAAHTMHPNGAQGFNLTLRDAAALAEQIGTHARAGGDPGAARVLEIWETSRRADQDAVIGFSHGLAQLFCSPRLPLRAVRRAALMATEFLPSFRNALLERASGLHGRQPAWVRGAASP
jgi:2-octaprenyl-6-methoxyphenol hydroxylase